MRPLISIIVPIYNTSAYLTECLLSIQKQTYEHLQVIMVDDGSTDNSSKIAEQFISDKRFCLIRQTNAGVSAARNRGLHEVKGEWVSFVDSDDFLDREFYASLLASHQAEECDMLLCGYTETTTTGTNLRKRIPQTDYQFISPWTRLLKYEFITRNRLQYEERQRYEDVLFAIDCWLCRPKITRTTITGYHYRLHTESFTAKRHPIAPLFRLINKRLHKHKIGLRLCCIIIYTELRLLLHFVLNRR